MPTQANQPLADGYQLQNYRILKVLSCGGFSIVYLAHDANDAPPRSRSDNTAQYCPPSRTKTSQLSATA